MPTPEKPSRVGVRWTARRKAEVLKRIADGQLSDAAACATHGLSPEELAAWRRDFAAHGEDGLRAMQVQQYRTLRRGQIAAEVHSKDQRRRDRIV
jgi:transposase-like protein